MIKIDTSDAEIKLKNFLSKIKLSAQGHMKETYVSTVNEVNDTLVESYKTKPGRPDFARTGALQKAVATHNKVTNTYAGIGEIPMLNREASYWEDVEKGTSKYVGTFFKGYFKSKSGARTRPSESRYPMDRWVDEEKGRVWWMEVTKPIIPHSFYAAGEQQAEQTYIPGFKNKWGSLVG